MARAKPPAGKKTKAKDAAVDNYVHEANKRKNIPTAELQRLVPEDQLNPVGPLCPEHIDRAAKRIILDRLPHDGGQSIRPFAEVHRLGRHHHPNRTRRPDHGAAFKTRINAAIVFVSAPRPARITTPANSISIRPAASDGLRPRHRGRFVLVAGSDAASNTAGTNIGAGVLSTAVPLCAARRQANNCEVVSPCRRATPLTVSAPV